MEIEMILGKDLVGRIYQKFENFSRPIAIISFEEIPEEIPDMLPEELGVLDEIESEIVFESSIFDPTDLVDVEDFI